MSELKESFHFLREIEPNTYMECYGVDFEDFEEGQVFEHRPVKIKKKTMSSFYLYYKINEN